MTDHDSVTSAIEIPSLTGIYAEPFSGSKLLRMASFFGPAAIVASLSIGAGETIMVTGLGAWSEYGLLWLLISSVLVKGVFVTYLVGRYSAVTGEGIGDRLIRLPGPRGWLLLAVVVFEIGVTSMALTAISKSCGNLITFVLQDYLPNNLSFATWENLCASLVLGAAMMVGLFSSFQSLERQQIAICAALVIGTLAATFIVTPDLGKMILGAISVGHLPTPPAWAPSAVRQDYTLNLVTIFGYVGGSLSGHIAYGNWVMTRGWGINSHPQIAAIRQRAHVGRPNDYLPDDPNQSHRLRKLLLPLRWDIGMGAAVLLIVTTAFLTAGATVLYPRHEVVGDSWELLTKQASIWRQIHQSLVPFYYVMVLLALWGTLASVPEAITCVAHSFFSSIWPRFKTFSQRRLQALIVAWFFLTSLVWTWSGLSFDILTQIGAFVTASLGLFIVFTCVLYLNVTLPRLYRPRGWMVAGGTISAIVLLLCTVGGAVGLARKIIAFW